MSTKLDEILNDFREGIILAYNNDDENNYREKSWNAKVEAQKQAEQAILDWADNQIKLAYREGYEAGREKIIKQQMEVKFQGLKRAGLKGGIDE